MELADDRRDVRSAILDAAEVVFAKYGFDGATTRAIAGEARVTLALIHYHFHSKENLFELAVARRAREVNDRRRDLLAQVLNGAAAPTLEGILEALMRPSVELGSGCDRGRRYARLVTHIASGSDERSVRLTSENFDQIAREFIAALRDNVPGLGHANAVWSYMNAISIGMLMTPGTGRVGILSDGACTETGTEETIARVVRYLAAGTRALAEGGQPSAEIVREAAGDHNLLQPAGGK